MKSKILLAAFLSLSLSACKEDQAQEKVNTVEWYKENQAERDAQLAKCQSNPGELALTPNCVNAKRAKNSSTWESTRGADPIAPLTADELKKK